MIYEEHTVKYGIGNGPVIVEVTAGYATLGRYTMALEDNARWTEFGRGDVADEIPDVFLVPSSGTALAGRFMSLVGNYAPGNLANNRQISVRYAFKQKVETIYEVEVKKEKDGVESCYHLIEFRGL